MGETHPKHQTSKLSEGTVLDNSTQGGDGRYTWGGGLFNSRV